MSRARRSVPRRADWPEPEPQSDAGAALTELVLTTFRLNGRLLDAANELARGGEITAALWQVLGGILDEPRTVSEIGRRMGMTRQGVQRNADLLVERGLAEYRENPAHRRAKLLATTEAGYWAIRRIAMVTHPWSERIGGPVGAPALQQATATMRELIDVIETGPVGPPENP